VNSDGARAVAAAAAKNGHPVVQISTDYVFDGMLDRAHCEEDSVAPASAYGPSKLAGEYWVAATGLCHVITAAAR
jgi:dTDP-4-dehydrorhamnose reductase